MCYVATPLLIHKEPLGDAGQVVLGELDKYEARCRNCFKIPKRDK